jgi:hypothetical protein
MRACTPRSAVTAVFAASAKASSASNRRPFLQCVPSGNRVTRRNGFGLSRLGGWRRVRLARHRLEVGDRPVRYRLDRRADDAADARRCSASSRGTIVDRVTAGLERRVRRPLDERRPPAYPRQPRVPRPHPPERHPLFRRSARTARRPRAIREGAADPPSSRRRRLAAARQSERLPTRPSPSLTPEGAARPGSRRARRLATRAHAPPDAADLAGLADQLDEILARRKNSSACSSSRSASTTAAGSSHRIHYEGKTSRGRASTHVHWRTLSPQLRTVKRASFALDARTPPWPNARTRFVPGLVAQPRCYRSLAAGLRTWPAESQVAFPLQALMAWLPFAPRRSGSRFLYAGRASRAEPSTAFPAHPIHRRRRGLRAAAEENAASNRR